MDFSGSLPVMLLGFIVALAAGLVRGFAGFGFSALSIAALAIFVPPASVVPALLLLEVIASIGLVRSALVDVDRAWIKALLLGNFFFIPLGIFSLTTLSEQWLRLLVSLFLLTGSLLLKVAGERRLADNASNRILTGVISGLLNGVAASGGVAAAMLMAATRLPHIALRGTMVIFLLFAGGYALFWAAILDQSGASTSNLLSAQTLRWFLLLAPGMFLGIWIGKQKFKQAHPSTYRNIVLNLLFIISALGLLRSISSFVGH